MRVEELGRPTTLGPVAAVRPLEVVVTEPGRKVGVDAGGTGVVAVTERGPAMEMQAGALEPLDEGVRARAKPKLQAPSTIVYCQTVPTPLSLPTYIVSAHSSAPTVSEPMCMIFGRSIARIARRARSVSGPPSAAESA